jgi:hypothetical protein
VQTQPFSPTPVHTAEDAAVTEMLFVDNPQISPTTGSDVGTIVDSNSIFHDFTTLQDEPSIDRSHPPTTSPSETRLHSSIDKPLDNNDLQSLALPQPVALNSFAIGPPLFTVAQPAIPACDAPHTSPQTISSPKFPTAAGSPANPIVPKPQHTPLTAPPYNPSTSDTALQQCSPGQGQHNDDLTSDLHEANEQNVEPRSSGLSPAKT